jgi:putative signal transducing protein
MTDANGLLENCHLEVLARFPNEVDAGVIANVLKAEGIMASLTDVNTAFFLIGAPVLVSVMVRREDVDRARRILDTMRSGESDIDWENVDVGEPE